MKSPKHNRRAAVAVEGAICLAVMLFIVFSGLDLSLAVIQYNSLCEASRRGARCAAVHGERATTLGTLGPTAMNFTADASNVIADSFRPVLTAMKSSDVKAQVAWPDNSNEVDKRVQVSLQYKHQSILPSFLGFGQFNFQSVSTAQIAH